MVNMAKTMIAPAVEKFAADMAKNANAKRALNAEIPCDYEIKLVGKLSSLTDMISLVADELQSELEEIRRTDGIIAESTEIRDRILPKMAELRSACDEAEKITAKSYWPMPTYADILFSVK